MATGRNAEALAAVGADAVVPLGEVGDEGLLAAFEATRFPLPRSGNLGRA